MFFCCQSEARTPQHLLCKQPLESHTKVCMWLIQMAAMVPYSNSTYFMTLKAAQYFIIIAVVNVQLWYGDLDLHRVLKDHHDVLVAKNRHGKLLTKQLYCIDLLWRQDKTYQNFLRNFTEKKNKQLSGWMEKEICERDMKGKHVGGLTECCRLRRGRCVSGECPNNNISKDTRPPTQVCPM